MRIQPCFAVALAGLLLTLNSVAGPGTLDPTYVPDISGGTVYATALQPNGELVIGGNFSNISGTYRNRLARLYSNGTLDTGFLNSLNGANNTVYCAVVEGDGRIVIGGTFTTLNNTTRIGVARLNSNGTLDGSFVPGNYYSVNSLAVQTNNQVILAGSATSGGPMAVFRLNADGTLDPTFTNNPIGNATANFPVYAVALQTDGKVLAGGSFTAVGGLTRNEIVRLNTDGTVDASFVPPTTINGAVRSILVQPDGKILIGGDFSVNTGKASSHVVRLATTGALDTNFTGNSYLNGSVYALALQANNSFLAGGTFSSYNYGTDLLRCYPDGTVDTNFYASFNSPIYALALQNDGGILVGGNFYISGTPSQYSLARVYGDLYPPQFTFQPTNRAVAVGSNVTFSAQVSNPTLTYFQWLKNGEAIPGATDMSYSLYNVQLGDAGTYAVAASNGLGENTSSNAALVVGLPPVITQQPASLIVTQGQTASFTAGASGVPLTYAWRFNGFIIGGATNATLTFASTVSANAGSYTCQITNFLGSVTTTPATLTVDAPPALLTQPLNQAVGLGSNLTLSVTANGSSPIAYQWWKDGNPLIIQTNASFTLTNVQTTDSGGYSVVLTNFLGSVTSSVATISVVGFPPVITSQPVGGIYLVGTNFTLSAGVSGTPPFNWQWSTNGVPILGANNPVYTVNHAQTNDSGAYTVTITNLSGGVTSSVAGVAVGYAPVIRQQPQSFTNAIGTSNEFGVTVSGSAPFLYQWVKDAAPLASGTNNPLVFPALQTNQIGYYFVTVTNLFGSVVSSNALLSISNVPLPSWWVGLVGYYPFSGNANDASGNGNNGVVNGATLTADRFGNPQSAYAFDGSASFIDLGYSPDFNFDPNGQFTLSGWFAIQGLGSGAGGIGSIIVKSPATGAWDYGLEANIYDQPVLWAGLNEENPCISTNLITTGAWTQGVLVYSNTVWQLFENGSLVVQTNTTYAITQSTGAVNIGRKGDDAADYFYGSIDDVRLYNRALSTNEVAQLYAYEADVPVLASQPQSQTVLTGGTATFNVTATAANPLGFQWYQNGAALIGATNAALVISNVSAALTGNYTVAVSNVLTGVFSAPALLTAVSPLTNSFPTIVSNQFGFHLSGSPGSSFVVETSTNLQTWTPLTTNLFGTNGFLFIDPAAATAPARYYRAHY